MAISIVNPYAVAAAGPFDPETAFNWHTLYWAEGTKSKALNYANGDRLTTISDEYGVAADNLTMSPSSPYYVYRSGSSLMNGQPCWYSQTTHGTMTTGTWVKTPPALALNSVVILYEPSVHGNYPWLISGVASQQIEIYEFTNSPTASRQPAVSTPASYRPWVLLMASRGADLMLRRTTCSALTVQRRS